MWIFNASNALSQINDQVLDKQFGRLLSSYTSVYLIYQTSERGGKYAVILRTKVSLEMNFGRELYSFIILINGHFHRYHCKLIQFRKLALVLEKVIKRVDCSSKFICIYMLFTCRC